jgi:hypothetical protein
MTPDEYLYASEAALRRDEKSVEDDTRALLILLLWRFRQSLIASLPDTGIGRQLILNSLLAPLALELETYAQRFRSILLTRLEFVDEEHSRRAADYAALAMTLRDYRPRRGDALLGTARSGGRSLLALFAPDPRTGLSPFTAAHLRVIRAKLIAAVMRDDPTIEIARTVVAERVRQGFIQPINSRGTLYSALRNRDTALIANAIWEVSGQAERAVFERQAYLTARPFVQEATGAPPFASAGWRYHALLDPKTCPICRPLDGLTSPRYTGFPYVPPVHPRCRCRILPIPTPAPAN